jgi:hypothetical protein
MSDGRASGKIGLGIWGLLRTLAAGLRKGSVRAAQKNMNEESKETGSELPPPCGAEEAVLLWVTVAVLCERLRPSNAMRLIVEAWAKQAVATAMREAAERGGWAGVLPKYWEELEVAISAFQAPGIARQAARYRG